MFIKRMDELYVAVKECVYTVGTRGISADKALRSACFLLSQVNAMGGIVYTIGNGGSAAIASHFVTDCLRTLQIAAATVSDPSALTCFSNDFGYEKSYSMQLERNAHSNDLLIAISSSGQSKNILNAVESALQKKMAVITLSGFSETNPLRGKGELNFWIDSNDYGLVETSHFFLLHTIVDLFESCAKKSNRLASSALS